MAFAPDATRAAIARLVRSSRSPQAQQAASAHWQRFWQTGGAIDLSSKQGPAVAGARAPHGAVRYLTAIQCSGSMPPAETGLTCNSWYGKFHLEMHWWHAAHFALWDRIDPLGASLG